MQDLIHLINFRANSDCGTTRSLMLALCRSAFWKRFTGKAELHLELLISLTLVRRLSETVNTATEEALLYSLELLLIKWKFDHFMFVIVCVFLLLEQGHK